jgi:LacI family transcriptional regulator
MIALMVADITNPVFFKVVRGAEKVAADEGYTLVVAESFESSKVEADSLARIMPSVDGVIFGTTRLADQEIHEANDEKPVVLINRVVDGVGDVVPDNEPGIAEAIAHLAELGHKHIGFLAGPAASWINTDRWNLLMKHALGSGMTVVSIGPNLPTVEGGRDGLAEVRASGVSAIITYNDLMGIGLLRAATAAGIRVPEDLSIIGFDNIFGSDFTSPPLTTIEMPLEKIGGNAVRALLSTLDDNDLVPHGSEESTSLLVRGSTGKAKS